LKNSNAYDVAFHVGKQTGLVRELFNDKSTEGVQRYENVQELLNSIKEWVDDKQNRAQIDDDGVMLDTEEGQGTRDEGKVDSEQLTVNSQPSSDNQLEEPIPNRPLREDVLLSAYLQQITLLSRSRRNAFSQCDEHQYTRRVGGRKKIILCCHHPRQATFMGELCQYTI
jgi:hypothetical protein